MAKAAARKSGGGMNRKFKIEDLVIKRVVKHDNYQDHYTVRNDRISKIEYEHREPYAVLFVYFNGSDKPRYMLNASYYEIEFEDVK
jgi:hypothetical protein